MTPKTDTYGLNKEARNAELRRSLKALPPPLDPPFPYDVVRFPAAFFEVSKYSDAAEDKQTQV